MRTFEIILLVVVTLLPFVKRLLAKRVQPNYIVFLLGVLMALHLVVEGYRWQMVPVYFLTFILTWRIKIVNITKQAKLSFIRILGFFGIGVLIILGWIFPMLLPVFCLAFE